MSAARARWIAIVACALVGIGAGQRLVAQLNESCTVSVLNRSAPVQPDGSWVLPNVPANLGPVRVRATCVDSAGVRSGASSLVTIPANGVISVRDIGFTAPPQIPIRVTLSASATQLTAAGQTVQITASAVYPDGSGADVTPAAAGTDYRSSNPAVASVTADGLVTARASGAVLVSASNEGALGMLQLTVLAGADSDGDGLPDDYEIAHGLDPNNPADALGDPDDDGLTTLAEFSAGTDPFKADTDGDGLRDGDEVNLYHTNPLLFDTDGDGISDGLEIQSGSDPLDAASFNLGPILQSLTAQPSPLDIVFNTALGEASRRLDVTGRLIDGTTIDLRRRSRGTSYSSDNLAVASFGAEDGVVFAGQNGTATVTVGNAGRSAAVQVRVTSFAPQVLSFLLMPGFANGVAAAGSFAYVAAGSAGLVVVDASAPQAPRIVAVLPLPGNANDVKVAGGFAYVAAGAAGLAIVDVRNPAAPVLAGRVDTLGTATDVAVQGIFAYVADGFGGLAVVDVGNPAAPVRRGGIATPGNARGVAVDGRLAVVAGDTAGVSVIDVGNPAAPVFLGATATNPSGPSHAAAVALRGSTAYVADGAGFNLGGLRTVDLSDPATPVVVGSSSDLFALTGVVLDGKVALTSDYYFVNAVPIFNLGGTAPVFAAVVDFSHAPSFRDDNGNGVAINDDGLVFMVGSRFDIRDNGDVGDTALHIARYKTESDTAGIPPEVSLTAPADGSSAPERNPLLVRASASDDVKVAAVQFLIDGVPVAEDVSAPYETTLRVPAGVPSITLTAVATDLGGNQTTSKPVVVTVLPDDRPTVAFLAPAAGAHVVAGATAEMAATATDDVHVDSVELFVDGASQGIFGAPPYRTTFIVPTGVTETTLTAVATDSGGQTATATQVIAVDPDQPPTVAVLAPTAGAQIVEGSRVIVTVGAADDVGISQVHLDADGQPAGDSFAAPYVFSVPVPAGATELRLTATAYDTAGQQATAEIVVSVIPDPLTTVTGRVVDGNGQGIANAAVSCSGLTGSTDAVGAFSIPGVPTVAGRIGCGAQAVVGGELLAGTSASAPAVLGGITAVGDITVATHIAYLGSGSGPDPNDRGRLLVLDAGGAGRLVDWSQPVRPAGLSGLAFDLDGTLWATTQPFSGFTDIAARGAGHGKSSRFSAPPDGTSRLLRLDADTGEVLAAIGPFTLGAGGPRIGLQDLTFEPVTGRLFALTAGFVARALVSLDTTSLVATVVSGNLPSDATGLAAGPDGRLALFVQGFSSSELWSLDPLTGAVVSTAAVTGTVGASAQGAEIGGMALKPGTRTFVLTSPADGTDLYELDLATLAVTEVASPAGDLAGAALRALAFRPLASAPVVTSLRGLVADPDGQPVVGADVVTLGAATSTGADGRFEIPGLRVQTGLVRVAVRFSGGGPLDGSEVLTPGVPPVPGGVTDLGTITLGAPACVTGFFLANRCAIGAVSGLFDLYVDDGTGQLALVDHVQTDPSGRFCANLRRGFSYVARREDVACTCGRISPCQTSLALTDPDAAGSCGAPGAACQDVGNVFLSCNFFCGGS